ncbi:hypothetical protein FPQ18DRAFT_244661, partial [Pyronema domesticum]
ILGEDHPDTLKAMNNLALTLQHQGRWDEAEKLQKKVVESSKVFLGEDHPDTLTTMKYRYYHQSSMDIGIEMMEEVVSRHLRILGSENESTKGSMKCLKS